MNNPAKRLLWMSDEHAHKIRADGFWRIVLLKGLLGFAISGVVLLTAIGLLWNGMQTFEMDWWRRGTAGIFIGGIVWGTSLWAVARMPLRWRETVFWVLAGVVALFLIFVIGGSLLDSAR